MGTSDSGVVARLEVYSESCGELYRSVITWSAWKLYWMGF
jgi:hypothetical protein